MIYKKRGGIFPYISTSVPGILFVINPIYNPAWSFFLGWAEEGSGWVVATMGIPRWPVPGAAAGGGLATRAPPTGCCSLPTGGGGHDQQPAHIRDRAHRRSRSQFYTVPVLIWHQHSAYNYFLRRIFNIYTVKFCWTIQYSRVQGCHEYYYPAGKSPN